jgi:hypothetical protein
MSFAAKGTRDYETLLAIAVFERSADDTVHYLGKPPAGACVSNQP